MGEGRSPKDDAGNSEGCKDQRLVLPGEPGIAPSDHCDTKRGRGEPDANHRGYGDLDHAENSPENGPIPERHHCHSVGADTAVLGAVRGVLKLSRATSAIPANDPIIDALSSGIRITFWLGVPARRPMASI